MRQRLCEATVQDITRRFGNNIRVQRSKKYSVRIKEYILDPFYIVFEVTGGRKPYEVHLAFKDVAPKTVTALKNAIRNNQIKLWCQCLHPDTKIKLLDGTSPTIAEMKQRFDKGEKLYVFSADTNGDFEPGEVTNVMCTGNADTFIRVTLDNGESILTTPEHPYMMRDGSYIEAQNLVVGQSLMPMYFREDNGYLSVYGKKKKGCHSVYKKVASVYHSDEIANKEIESQNDTRNMGYKVAIHHKDFNKHNNNPENLQVMTTQEHWDYHASLSYSNLPEETQRRIREASSRCAAQRNAHPTDRMIESRKLWAEKGRLLNYTDERRSQQSLVMKNAITQYYDSLTEQQWDEKKKAISQRMKQHWNDGCFNTDAFKNASVERGKFLHTEEMEAKTADGIRKYWNNLSDDERHRRNEICSSNLEMAHEAVRGKPKSDITKYKMSEAQKSYRKRIAIEKCTEVVKFLSSSGLAVTMSSVYQYSKQLYGMGINPSSYWNSLEEMLLDVGVDCHYNHKVVSVETIVLDEPIPVYDISVDQWQNFTLDAGVVVHNCPDFKFRFNYLSTKHGFGLENEHRPPNIRNPKDNLGPACKHVAAVIKNLNWTYALISDMKKHENKSKEEDKDK